VTSALSPLRQDTVASVSRQIAEMMEADPVTAGLAVAQTAHTYVVENDEDDKNLTDGLVAVATATKALEKEQKRLLDLLVAPVEAFVRGGFREKLDLLKQARDVGQRLILDYRAKRRARLDAEAEAQRKQAAAAAAQEQEEQGGLVIPQAAVAVERPSNITRGGVGSSIGTKKLQVRMVDVKLVAANYPHLLALKGADADGWVKGPTQGAILEVKSARLKDLNAALPGLQWEEVEGLTIRGR
jgi:hypothetical protein